MLLKILKNSPLLLLVIGIAFSLAICVMTALHPAQTYSYAQLTLLAPIFDRLHDFPLLKTGLGFATVLIMAVTWNTIVNKHSLLKQSSYFPLFFMLLLLSCRPALIGFYPALVSSLFLMLAIHKLISSYMRERALSEAFDAGLFVGIATLFYIPSMVFLVLLWIGLLLIRTISGRELVCTIIGFLIPFLFTYTYNLVFFPSYRWYHKILSVFSYHNMHLSLSWQQILIIAVILLAGIGSLWFFINRITDNVVKGQKFWILMLWVVLFATGSVFLCPDRDARVFSSLAIPGSFILSAYFLKTRAKILPELLFISLIAGVIISIFF